MTRCARLALLLAGAALLAGLAVAACAGRGEPDAAYLESLPTWTASRLLHEHKALRAEEEALAARLAEAGAGDLPPTAREAAQRSLDDSLRTVQAKRQAVDQALASGRYARSEKRYPVQQLVLRAEPPAPEPPAAPRPATGPANEAPPQAQAAVPPAPAPAVPATPEPRAAMQDSSGPQGPAGAQSVPPNPAARPETTSPPAAPPGASAAASPEPPAAERTPAAPAAARDEAGTAGRKVSPASAPAPAPDAAQNSPAPAGPVRVLGVETARTAQGLEVRVHMEGKAARRLFTLGGPPRIVLDITGVAEPAFRLFNRTLGAVEARSLRLGWHNAKAMLRLVLDTDPAHLDRAVLEETADGLVLRIAP